MTRDVGENQNRQTLQRLRKILSTKITTVARGKGVDPQLVRKQYVFALFFKRLFHGDTADWMLLGGNALLIRAGGGRFTRDIDLARDTTWEDPAPVREELQALVNAGMSSDPFRFELGDIDAHSDPDSFGYGSKTAKITVTVWLGNRIFDTFIIDITNRRHDHGPVDMLPLSPVIEHETLADLPDIPVVAVENHLADKICAMYELHGRNKDEPSTRYRDLADLVRLISSSRIDAARLREVLDHEQQRRGIVLPQQLQAPSPRWVENFPRAAKDFAEYPVAYHPLEVSVDVAGRCLDPILAGAIMTGQWDPISYSWQISSS
ncbi:nucleotidyl transferase AbiEii/AbiGii toxin family protein [Corynebacterium sp. A21]|uniref:nucleotidyl transferase AbiEii/AbiGii toxin family protein n=1 Tax=Corynebacterium sp. A21 TaxID=3457318 RepID=UPI003FD4CEF8